MLNTTFLGAVNCVTILWKVETTVLCNLQLVFYQYIFILANFTMSGRKQDCVWLYFNKTKVVGICARNVAKKCIMNEPALWFLPRSTRVPRWSSGSVLDHRSLPPMFESWHGHIWRLFHLKLHYITIGGRSAHLAYQVHKSGCKTSPRCTHSWYQYHSYKLYIQTVLKLIKISDIHKSLR